MARGHALLALLAAAAALGLGACGSSGGAEGGRVAVLLPDTDPVKRWETLDRPFLERAFAAAGVAVEIQNAGRDRFTQQQQADQAIADGAKVLLLVNLDSGSGAAIAAGAKDSGVKVIDYDRLTLDGDSDYYVSFDNVQVGRLQGQGLVDCLAASGGRSVVELNGSPTDNNATLFKRGYDSVLAPLYDQGRLTRLADESVPDWDNEQGRMIFERMLDDAGNQVDGVLAANDGLAHAAISTLRERKLDPVPVTGQDATLQAIRHIVAGEQCMTVYKPIRKEADAAAKLAVALLEGETPSAPASIDNGARRVPAVFERSAPVTRETIADYVGEPDFPALEDICARPLADECRRMGLL